jgi:hypothetical protein
MQGNLTMSNRLFSFSGLGYGGEAGPGDWHVTAMHSIAGAPLPAVGRLTVAAGDASAATAATWALRGMASNDRYVTRPEKSLLLASQEGLGRPQASCAALIPIRKTAAWWALTQDERRQVFEEQSHHTRIGLGYLPAIARKLHHCRDLSEHEPFDFLTWFEYAPEHEEAFDALLAALRASPEWAYLDREVDIRLVRAAH